jgi:MFS family permease
MADASSTPTANQNGQGGNEKLLFWACFIALIATAFGFIIRAMIIEDWGEAFGLDETQKGEIFGVGLWPFALSIVLFSLIIDKIGYGKAMLFAFVCHASSAVITIFATGYETLYLGTFIVAIGNGTVEAVINPVVATMFPKEKTKWLNILHAGWPGGLVLGGLIMIGMPQLSNVLNIDAISWQWKVGLILIPTLAYGAMMLQCKFPINERIAAGVPYKSMLQEVGIIGSIIVVGLMVREVGRVFDWDTIVQVGVAAALVAGYGAYVKTLGRPLFVFLLLIMIPLAITELGTDSWITPLMEPEMKKLGLQAGWVLVYTSLIMMVLRFFAGPIVHAMSPLGLLATSSLVAATGLVFLSKAEGMAILAAATLYGFGKTFFWPTMLGVVAERFPKGGALTLNTIAGVGMMGAGIIGTALLGNIQDRTATRELQTQNPTLHAEVVGQERLSVFGKYQPLDGEKIKAVPQQDQQQVTKIREGAKKDALTTVAVLPVIMLVCYLGMILYFRTQGGYKAEVLTGHDAEDEEFTGGVEGPVA